MVQTAKDRDRALARTGASEVPDATEGDIENEGLAAEGLDASKILIVHIGSQNMRIGLACDALPKTVPMCIAYKWATTESAEYEALPKRQKLNTVPEQTIWRGVLEEVYKDVSRFED